MRYLSLVSAALLSLANKFKLFPLLARRPRTLVAVCGLLVALAALPTHAQPCAQPPSGMVAWWPLDETGGTAVSDHSPLGLNPGTASGPIGSNPKSVPGFVGNGLNFFFGSRVSVTPSPSLNFGTNTSFTIDAWIKGGQSPIVSNYDSSTGKGYSISVSNYDTLALQSVANALFLQGPVVPRDAWTFVAVVVDRASQMVTFYVGTPLAAFPGLLPSQSPALLAFPAVTHWTSADARVIPMAVTLS
jgi:hypothetical protein